VNVGVGVAGHCSRAALSPQHTASVLIKQSNTHEEGLRRRFIRIHRIL